MSLTPTIPRNPLLRALADRRAPTAAEFPELMHAAGNTKAHLDTEGADFHAAQACLETIVRLRLSARKALLLLLLARKAVLSRPEIGELLRVSDSTAERLVTDLHHLRLVQTPDAVLIELTPAGRNVAASIVALTALGAASSVLLRLPR